METPPRGRLSSRRVPTPQISERKKRLFENLSTKSMEEQEEQYALDGIRPLSPDLTNNNIQGIDFNKSVKIMLKKTPTTKMSFLKDNQLIDVNMFTKYSEPIRRSPRSLSKKNNSDIEMLSPRISNHIKNYESIKSTITTPENRISSPTTPKNKINCTDELGKLFKNSLHFKNDKKKVRKEIGSDESFVMSSTDNETDSEIEEKLIKNSSVRKRVHLEDDLNRETKIFKLDENLNNNNNNQQIQSIDNIKISTKSFYSNKENKTINILSTNNRSTTSTPRKKNRIRCPKAEARLFNKGVHHNIKKPQNQKKISIDDMLKTIRFEKFKFLPSHRLPQDKIDLVHKILAENKNPIEMAKPLNININTNVDNLNFSDIENSSESDSSDTEKLSVNEENEGRSNCHTTNKFFKSARNTTTKKEITITDNIKATFINGKIALKKKKKKKKKSKIMDYSFSDEQFQVNKIIENLNESLNKNTPEKVNIQQDNENISSTSVPKTSDFLNRLPYKTTDPELIEQQHLLLGFLIANDICNEKNFNIFIADPDNHKEEANQICNNLVCLMENIDGQDYQTITMSDEFDKFRKRIPYKTNDPIKIEEQNLLLDFLIANQICTEENFKIFITEPENHKEKAEIIINNIIMIVENNDEELIFNKENQKQNNNIQNHCMETEIITPNSIVIDKNKLFPIFYYGKKCQPIQQKSTRYNNKIKNNLLRSAIGSNQYQIDAGQKEYGAKQCPQCGLVYTVHEPEEEILHNEYHKSINILKFRSWIDEDVIANYPEWGNDGRIIRLSSSCSSKKRERLMDVLKIVDKELGFSSYILPSEFVAFLAIRKQQIVGLCLVQFLDSANRYILVNGVDCCTEEDFEARCGISRIWISPLHRRLRIASKLILSVQSHTITGELIDLDKIAFSSPTEDGKKFAQKVTNRTDFLIYQ